MQARTRRAAALAGVLLVLLTMSAPAAGQASTDTSTVIVVVGDSPSHLLAGHAIADKKSGSVVRVPESGLTPQVRDLLKGRMTGGNLRKAIVVGPSTDKVASQLRNVSITAPHGDTIHLRVADQVTGRAGTEIFLQASEQTWTENSANTGFVVADGDYRKIAVALANDSVHGPVLSANTSAAKIEGKFGYYGISTIYVSPNVPDDLRQELNESFNVSTAPAGVTLAQSVSDVATAYSASNEDVVVANQDHVLMAASVGFGSNTSVLVAESSSNLGEVTATELESHTNSSTTYVYGEDVPIDEIQATAPGKVVQFPKYPELRTNLVAAEYDDGVLVRNMTKTGMRSYVFEATNIGFATIPETAGWAAKFWWMGEDISTTPSGYEENGRHYVRVADPITPGETVEIRVEATSLSNGGYPYQKYRFQDGGSLVYVKGGATGGGILGITIPDWLAYGFVALLSGGVVWYAHKNSSSQDNGSLVVTLLLVVLWLAIEVGLILFPFDGPLGDVLWPVFTGLAWLGRTWIQDYLP